MGWNYAMQWLIVLPLELSAASIVVDYWNSGVNNGVFITLFLIVVVCINMFGVKGYGEAEFVFSIIKVIAVLGFIICAICIDVGASPSKTYFGTETWRNPGAFNNGFPGLCACFVNAAFSFGGTELVGLAAAEASNPVKTLPKATKQVCGEGARRDECREMTNKTKENNTTIEIQRAKNDERETTSDERARETTSKK
jgi:yeast amino acid transporter